MHYVWKRRDFSGNSKVRLFLLEKLLEKYDTGISEIPEEYQNMVAAAGTDQTQWNSLKEWKKLKPK